MVSLASLKRICLLGSIQISLAAPTLAGNATAPGELSAPHPTVENVSIRWEVSGDDNQTGAVSVRYRPCGSATWKPALPLMHVAAGRAEGVAWTNHHAGSIFGLAAGTAYEVELALVDPDGGSTTRAVTVSTRKELVPAADARVVHVTPATFDRAIADAQPGDLLLLADGAYSSYHGPTIKGLTGTVAKPIAIRAVNSHGAVFPGFMLPACGYVIVEGIAVSPWGFNCSDSHNLVIKGCKITSEFGLYCDGPKVANLHIADNRVVGGVTWEPEHVSSDGKNYGTGIYVGGPGHVLCHNYVQGFRDGIGFKDDVSDIDIFRNDIAGCGDDGIEADFGRGNIRVYENRIYNCWTGISSQPSLGGPTYMIRNVMYNILRQTFKLKCSSVGNLIYHNTVVKSGDGFQVALDGRRYVFSHTILRNNLILGGTGGATYRNYPTGDGKVLDVPTADSDYDFDYDGYGSIGTGRFAGIVGKITFSSLAEMRQRTTEKHAVQLDLNDFMNMVPFPDPPFPARPFPASLELKAGSAAVDQGQMLSNVNDGFVGAAPDLGAHELGSPLPQYGPRLAERQKNVEHD